LSKFDLTERLNDMQLQAVRSIEGPVLIIAGAGSGKTRVITYRIAHMLEKGIPQSSILALTFTNKAAREMENRIKELTQKKLQSLTVSTFHAFGLGIIRNECELLGYRKNFSVYDDTDRISLIKDSLRECKKLYSSKNGKVDFYALCQKFSKIKTGIESWNENDDMRDVFEEYNQQLKIYNAFDFDDLLTVPLELFTKHEDIANKYRQRYRYILVDEFQDTSFIQYKMMKLLTRGENSNVCVVGDDDQSIYSWRGANYENILMFEKDFPRRLEIKLEQNYRSTSAILDAANGVISHNTGRKDKNLWSGNKGGKPVDYYQPENETGEGEFIAGQIRLIMGGNSYKYHDFGVLTRTNSLARNIEEAFLADNIPYKVSGGTSFFQRKEIKDISSYLRVIANPGDDVSLLRIINTPRRGIGKNTIALLNELARKNKNGIYDALLTLNYARAQGQQGLFEDRHTITELEEFSRLIENFKEIFLERKAEPGKKWLLSQCVRSLVDAVDYWSYLILEHGKDEKKARWKYGNIEYYIRMIENWESDPDNPDAGLYPWLNRISLITRDDGEDDNEGRVNLMTIHAAKGLEFEVVFIAGAEEGLIPHERSISNDEDGEPGSIEEERRLFYVAITRAREKLYITSCKKRRRLQSVSECSPSPFLDEIPQNLIKYHEDEPDSANAGQADNFLSDMKTLLGA
jgi:DNA helicase-2/ATP-dependent DNA helicase PcrA